MAKDGMTVLKRMLAVNIENGEVIEYSVARLKYDFHVYDGRMKAFVITDYDHYFSLKEQYERLLSDIVDGRSTDLEGLVSLAKKILSPEQYKNTILHISGNIYH